MMEIKRTIHFVTAILLIITTCTTILLFKEVKKYKNKGKNIMQELTIETNNTQIENVEDSDIKKFNACYNEPIERDNFTEEMNSKLSEIENYFKSSRLKVSFSYEDMQTGMHIGYNETEKYFTASVIKSPVVLYIYKMNLNNEIDFNEIMTYTPDFYMGGTGSIQYQPLYTNYTVKDLISKTIIESDNIAYAMLCSKVSKDEIKNFYHEKGATTFWEQNNTIWGEVNSKDGVIYMKELYNFIEEHPELKQDILDKYLIASNKLINLDNSDIPIAHKSGWTNAAIHDMAIIYNKQPYVLSINTLLGDSNFTPFFYKASNLINEFHEIYWNQKLEYCYNKIFK